MGRFTDDEMKPGRVTHTRRRVARLHRGFAIAVLLFAASVVYAPVSAAQHELTVEHIAGSTGGRGWFDGIARARFDSPAAVASDGSGNVYVADNWNNTIRRIAIATGEVTTLAGTAGVIGSADGIGGAATFNRPWGITYDSSRIALDGSASLYVSDTFNHTIRKILIATGEVTTLAGTALVSGSANGTGAAARFNQPFGITADGGGNLFVAGKVNHTIRQIVIATGDVTTLAGSAGVLGSADGTGAAARFKTPWGVAADGSGNVFVADTGNHTIRKIVVSTADVTTLAGTAGSTGSTDATGSAARFYAPTDVAADSTGNVFVSDTNNSTIRQIVVGTAVVTTLAGRGYSGSVDGVGAAAAFSFPRGIAVDASGSVFVADNNNDAVRRVIVASGEVTTLAGAARLEGSTDGAATSARFKRPRGIAADSAGNVYVADTDNCTIRRIDAVTREVTTLAGTAGVCGWFDGTGPAAKFSFPKGLVVVDVAGTPCLFVTDGNYTIRKIVIATGVVTTLAGWNGQSGTADGIGSAARFNGSYGIASDGAGNLYVADTPSHTIRKIDLATAEVTTIAGSPGSSGRVDAIGADARFNSPNGLACNGDGTLFVADTSNSAIRRIVLATNSVVTVAGSLWGATGAADGFGTDATFQYPSGIAVDPAGNAYVADTNNVLIRKLIAGTGEVVTVAGSTATSGAVDGTGSEARIGTGFAIAMGGADDVYIADYWNQCIRIGTTPLADVPTIDQASALPGTQRQLDTSPQTATAWTWEIVRRPSTSAATLSSTSVRNPTITPDVLDHFVFRLTAEGAGQERIATVTFKGGYGLTVSRDGAGTGTVTSSPGGIDCGSVCSGAFGSGSSVTLAATPDYGSAFTGWSGGDCSGTGTCTLTMTGVQSVTATFGCGSWYLDLDGDGHGQGAPLNTCAPPPGYASLGDDCDDSLATVYPGAPEICDGIDNDCDGFIEETSFSGVGFAAPMLPASCGFNVAWSPATTVCQPVLYNVYRSTDPLFVPDASNRIAACVSASIYDDSTGLANLTDYYYVVRAETGSGSGPCGGTEDSNLVRVQAWAQLTCVPAPEPLSVFTITARDQSAVLSWLGPDQGPAEPYSIMFQYSTDGYSPTDPGYYSLAHLATGQLFGATGSATVPYLLNNSMYWFGGFVDDGAGIWSAGKYANVRPFSTTGKVKWGYGTAATATTPPGLRVNNMLYAVSNDRVLHGMTLGTAGGEWPVGWKPMLMNGPSQSRPIPITLKTFTIGGANSVVFVTSQDGRVYAVDGDTGTMLWASAVLADGIQASPSACLAQNGCSTDLVIVPTRNGSSDNRIVALDPETGTITASRGWEFDNGGGANGIGIISGQAAVRSSAGRLYFASRQKAGGTSDTVFCLEFDSTSVTKVWSRAIGDVDGGVILSGDTLYVGTNNGEVHALNLSDGSDKWTVPYTVSGDGPVNTMVWADGTGKLFFSTQSQVFGIVDNGQGTAPSDWWTAPMSVADPSHPFVYRGKAYVSSSDGRVYEVDTTTPTPTPVSVQVTSPGSMGRATLDSRNQLLHVGTESGVLFAIAVPF